MSTSSIRKFLVTTAVVGATCAFTAAPASADTPEVAPTGTSVVKLPPFPLPLPPVPNPSNWGWD